MRPDQPRIRRRTWMALAALVGLCGFLGVLPAAGLDAQAAPVDAVTVGPGSLIWGLKQSWRSYAGHGTPASGATQDAGGITTWPLVEGRYDPVLGATSLSFGGSVHWQGHYAPDEPTFQPPPGYTGPTDIYLLDVTLSNPRITITADRQVVTVEATSRSLDTWELVDHGRLDLAYLDIDAQVPIVSDGTTSWPSVPAVLSEVASRDVFFNQYRPSQPIDPLSFSYTGPGGPPDLSDHWTAPGTIALDAQDNVLVSENLQFGIWAIDAPRLMMHYSRIDADQVQRLYAFDLSVMAVVGDPLVLESLPTLKFIDDAGRMVIRTTTGVDGYIRWNPATLAYETGSLPAVPLATSTPMLWDPVGHRLLSIRRVVPPGVPSTDYDNHRWVVSVMVEGLEAWTTEEYVLPSGPPGCNQRWYTTAVDTKAAALTDDSLVLARDAVTCAGAPYGEPLLVQHINLSTTPPTVTSIPDTATEPTALFLYDRVLAGPDRQFALFRDGSGASRAVPIPGLVVTGRVTADGVVDVDPRVELGAMDARAAAVDPTDATVWLKGAKTQDLAAVRDGRLAYHRSQAELHPEQQAIVVGPNHAVYASTNDGTPPPPGGGTIHGFGRWDRLGVSPTVADGGDPIDVSVTVESSMSTSTVAFTASATADPEPTVQWQVRSAGMARFTNVGGATASTMTFEAGIAQNGSEYRAVFTNPAGATATNPARLEVLCGPACGGDPGPPGSGQQQIAVAVPDLEAGVFAWQIVGTGNEVTLGNALDRGDHWQATGSLLPITIADTRPGGPPWAVSGQLSDFTAGVSGKYLGWTPTVIAQGAGAVAGAAVPSGSVAGEGLAQASTLAYAPAGHAAGSATIGGTLALQLPRTTPAGSYTATLTITALS